MIRFRTILVVGLLTLLTGLSGCGGGSGGGGQSAGIGGTGRTSSGAITGFGSIFVNGVKHDISSSSISVDDSSGSESDLRIGMVVTIEGTVSGTTGRATSVTYDDVLQGPISSAVTDTDTITKTFTVFSIPVMVDSSGTVFDNTTTGFGFDTIATNDIVEISGYFDAAGVLHATYIDKEGVFSGAAEVELKGLAAVAGAGATLGDSFTLQGIDVDIDPAADLGDVPGALVTNGMFVEVKGNWDGARINATRIEQESSSIGDDGDDISLEGLVSAYISNSNFLVNGHPVDASSASFAPAGLATGLMDGLKVEVEGTLVAGVLVASEVESRGGEIKVHATVNAASVTNATSNEGFIWLTAGNGTIRVATNSRTSMEDETGVTASLRINGINSGDFLEVSAYEDASGIVATEIKRRAPDDVIVQGPVDAAAGGTITLLGVSFSTDGGTQFEDTNDLPLAGGSATFYGSDRTGQLVKIKDDLVADTVADEVDLED